MLISAALCGIAQPSFPASAAATVKAGLALGAGTTAALLLEASSRLRLPLDGVLAVTLAALTAVAAASAYSYVRTAGGPAPAAQALVAEVSGLAKARAWRGGQKKD